MEKPVGAKREGRGEGEAVLEAEPELPILNRENPDLPKIEIVLQAAHPCCLVMLEVHVL